MMMAARFSLAAWRMKYTALTSILIGVVVGFAITPTFNAALDLYDRANPVVRTTTTVLWATDSDVLIQVTGIKLRACVPRPPIDAYGIDADGNQSGAYIVRTDQEASGKAFPLGAFGPMTWRIYPRAGAVKVIAFASYFCSGRPVVSKFAEADL